MKIKMCTEEITKGNEIIKKYFNQSKTSRRERIKKDKGQIKEQSDFAAGTSQ